MQRDKRETKVAYNTTEGMEAKVLSGWIEGDREGESVRECEEVREREYQKSTHTSFAVV